MISGSCARFFLPSRQGRRILRQPGGEYQCAFLFREPHTERRAVSCYPAGSACGTSTDAYRFRETDELNPVCTCCAGRPRPWHCPLDAGRAGGFLFLIAPSLVPVLPNSAAESRMSSETAGQWRCSRTRTAHRSALLLLSLLLGLQKGWI